MSGASKAAEAELDDGVLTLTLTLHGAARHEARLQATRHDAAVRVLLLRMGGEGGGAGLVPTLEALPQPVVAMVSGDCDADASGLLAACDIVLVARGARLLAPDGVAVNGAEAELTGLVTRSFPTAELEPAALSLAKELAAKDDLALRFTKQTLRKLSGMDWPAVLAYNTAKAAELKALQTGRPSGRAAAIESFLAGKSKPGLGR